MRILFLSAVLLTLCGCASTGAKIDPAQLNEVRKGQTTVAEIVNKFGRPNLLSKNWDGTQTAAYANTGGAPDSGTLLPLMGAVVAGAGKSVDSVIFYFDAKGVLTDYKSMQAANEATAQQAQPAPASAAAPPATGVTPPAQTTAGKPAPARTEAAKKSSDKSALPWWLPSEVRDTRQ
jgi:hypothetical protein